MQTHKMFYSSVTFIFVYILALVISMYSEFTSGGLDIKYLYITTLLLIISGVLTTFLPKTIKHKLKKYSVYLVFISIVITCTHIVVNSINIYKITTLPPLFYVLKMHRFVSLSSMFITQLFTIFFGLFIILRIDVPKKIISQNIKSYTLLFLIFTVLVQAQHAFSIIYKETIHLAVNSNTNFSDRITYRLGGTQYYGWIWPYAEFIKRHTPENALVAIPPQSVVWKMEGNNDYFRWFMYPRKLIKELPDGTIPAEATHVLIALGECNEGDCGWPKITIPKERIDKIILIDRETQQESVVTDTDYYLNIDQYKWGLITLKK